MIRGLYTAASGMLANQLRQDITANNLANVDTTGFKEEQAVFKPYPQKQVHRTDDEITQVGDRFVDHRPHQGQLNTGVQSDGSYTNFEMGSFEKTGNPLDMALQGEGFFVVQGADGEPRYTRDGSFSLNGEGQLVTSRGRLVLDQSNQPIEISTNISSLNVTEDGLLLSDDNQLQGRLRLVGAETPQRLEQVGDNLYRQGDAENNPITDYPDGLQVRQGVIETSNVNAVEEMVDMIDISRQFEMNSRVVRSHDQTLTQAVRTVGRA